MVRLATSAGTDSIAAIYNHYVANTVVTFEEEAELSVELGSRERAIHAAIGGIALPNHATRSASCSPT